MRLLPVLALVLAAVAGAGCVLPPDDVACRSDAQGNHLTWSPAENATSYIVYRVDMDEEDVLNATLVALGETTETAFTDADVVQGETYRYAVTSVGVDAEESPPGELCEVTAVPEFPSMGVAALAGAAALAGFVALRRRG